MRSLTVVLAATRRSRIAQVEKHAKNGEIAAAAADVRCGAGDDAATRDGCARDATVIPRSGWESSSRSGVHTTRVTRGVHTQVNGC